MTMRFLATMFFCLVLGATSVPAQQGLGHGKLNITNAEGDLESGMITIAGQFFGSATPIVALEGISTPFQATNLAVATYMEPSQILALLPEGLEPGDYAVTVTDGADPTRHDTLEFAITQAQGGPAAAASKLELHGAESDFAGGALLISGTNLGDNTTLPADFQVTLFNPAPSMMTPGEHIVLNVVAFDSATQELAVNLPAGLVPGTFSLTITKGNQTDTLDVTLDGDMDRDPENEAQTLSQAGSEVSLSSVGGIGGGTVSVNDADSDPNNELNSAAALNVTTLEITDAGGTLGVDLSSLVDDADADPTNELNSTAALSGTVLQITDAGGTLGVDLSSLVDDADADPTNEMNRSAVLNGSTLEITDGGGTLGVDLSGLGNDADADPNNELQSLSVSGTFLTLSSGGGIVDLNPNITTSGTITSVGQMALAQNTTGEANTAVGFWALLRNDVGRQNTAVGTNALGDNTSGNHNTAVGTGSLSRNNSGFSNTAVGTASLTLNTFGVLNTAVGQSALFYNTSGSNNSAFGAGALESHQTGWGNSAFGRQSLLSNTTGWRNTALGLAALKSNLLGSQNTAVGADALSLGTGGSANTGIGVEALRNTTGQNNVALGWQAGSLAESGSNNIFIGNNGQAADEGAIRVGTEGTHQKTFIAGVRNTNPVADPKPVVIDTDGQLGTVEPGISTYGRYSQTNRVDTPGGAHDTVQVSCQQPGQKVLGGGGMSGLNACISLARSRPVTDTTWSATFVNHCGGYVWQHEITAFVICAQVQVP